MMNSQCKNGHLRNDAGICDVCRRQYKRAYARKQRAANPEAARQRVRADRALLRGLLDQIKGLAGCAKQDDTCDGNLEFDHIVPRNLVGGKALSEMGWAGISTELAGGNIQVLCTHHNRTKAYRLEGAAREHGRTTTYQRGCRCDLCRQANTDVKRRYRERLRAGRGLELDIRGSA